MKGQTKATVHLAYKLKKNYKIFLDIQNTVVCK